MDAKKRDQRDELLSDMIGEMRRVRGERDAYKETLKKTEAYLTTVIEKYRKVSPTGGTDLPTRSNRFTKLL